MTADDRFVTEQTLTVPHDVVEREATVRPGGVVGPADAFPAPTEMSLKDFHQTGLMWWINHALLWDLGLSLAVEIEPLRPGQGENSRIYRRLFIRDHVPARRLGRLYDDGPEWEAFQRWLSNRAGTVR